MKVVFFLSARLTAVYHMSAQAGPRSRDIGCISVSTIIVSRDLNQSSAIAVETEEKSKLQGLKPGGERGRDLSVFPLKTPTLTSVDGIAP